MEVMSLCSYDVHFYAEMKYDLHTIAFQGERIAMNLQQPFSNGYHPQKPVQVWYMILLGGHKSRNSKKSRPTRTYV